MWQQKVSRELARSSAHWESGEEPLLVALGSSECTQEHHRVLASVW